MAKIKLTKSVVDAVQAQAQPIKLRDTLVPGFMCKVTPTGRKIFMLQYRTNAGERRKPALGLYGERASSKPAAGADLAGRGPPWRRPR